MGFPKSELWVLFLPLSLLFLGLARLASAQNAVSLTPAARAAEASVISQPLPPTFVGIGIEPSNLYSFTGGETANRLSINLLQNLANYSGGPLHVRIGGNTQDYFIYDASHREYSLLRNPHSIGQGAIASDHYIFGPSFFSALDRFPSNTPVTFGLNMAYFQSDYIENIVKEARAVLDNLKNVYLYSFEIGNEPDLYLQNGFRNGSWDGRKYTQEWLARAEAVYEQVLKPAGLNAYFFESACTASTIGTTFTINDLIRDGITKGNYVAAWSQHDYFYYIGVSTYGITLRHLLELSNTELQFAHWAGEVRDALTTGYPYVLREMASVGPIGLAGVSDTFGASLWTLNFFLYTATLNISSIQMHLTDNSQASPWQPVAIEGNGPHVRPNYYAWASMAQLIGSGNGTTRIASLSANNVPTPYRNFVRIYAAYTNSDLSAVIIINSMPANMSDGSKSSLTFSLSLPSSANSKTLYLSYLTAAGSDATNGTTWNGMSYEGLKEGASTRVSSEDGVNTTSVQISNQLAYVTVRDSQAVIANLGYRLGSNAAVMPNSTRPIGRKTVAKSAATSASVPSLVIIWAATTSAVLGGSSIGAVGLSEGRISRWPRRTFLIIGVFAALAVYTGFGDGLCQA